MLFANFSRFLVNVFDTTMKISSRAGIIEPGKFTLDGIYIFSRFSVPSDRLVDPKRFAKVLTCPVPGMLFFCHASNYVLFSPIRWECSNAVL